MKKSIFGLVLGTFLLAISGQASYPPVRATGQSYLSTTPPYTVVANPINLSGSHVTGTLPFSSLTCPDASGSQKGCLTAADWNTFNAKLDASSGNYITNPGFETDTSDWNLYSDAGRTTPAYVVNQDITYTSVLPGDLGNGATVTYTFHATAPYTAPVVTCPTATSVQVAWYNGPTLANNPTATAMAGFINATPCAVLIVTPTITGTGSTRQYEVGTTTLANGGDTQPVNGTGGSATGVTITRSTSSPLAGLASGVLSKDSLSREGAGVSTDFQINSLDKGQMLQVSVAYSGSSDMVLGTSSDVRMFIYDITNDVTLPLSPRATLTGPVATTKTFVGTFTASASSVNYRLIAHIATDNAHAWDLQFDNVVVNSVVTPGAATEVPSVVLSNQAISGAVTDHMAVVWNDGASSWTPAVNNFTDYWAMYGFATNLVGLTADVYIRGKLDGFSFGPFSGYNQYVDAASPGLLTPIYPGTSNYVIMGKAISSTEMNIQPFLPYYFNITTKGMLMTGNGTNDTFLPVGTNGQALIANSGVANGINWAPAVVAAAPFTYTLATRTLTIATATDSVAGVMSAADHTTFTGHAPKASPTFTGTVTLPAINLINGASNGTNTVLVYKDGHVKSTTTTAPTASVNGNAGTSGTCAVANATDSAGKVTITTGSGAVSTGAYCAINFNKAYGVAPICVATPAGSILSSAVYLTSSTSALTVNFASAASVSSAYVMNYHCMETQ